MSSADYMLSNVYRNVATFSHLSGNGLEMRAGEQNQLIHELKKQVPLEVNAQVAHLVPKQLGEAQFVRKINLEKQESPELENFRGLGDENDQSDMHEFVLSGAAVGGITATATAVATAAIGKLGKAALAMGKKVLPGMLDHFKQVHTEAHAELPVETKKTVSRLKLIKQCQMGVGMAATITLVALLAYYLWAEPHQDKNGDGENKCGGTNTTVAATIVGIITAVGQVFLSKYGLKLKDRIGQAEGVQAADQGFVAGLGAANPELYAQTGLLPFNSQGKITQDEEGGQGNFLARCWSAVRRVFTRNRSSDQPPKDLAEPIVDLDVIQNEGEP